MTMQAFRLANTAAFALPALLLGGAWGAQLIGGLYPCEMCLWQRWPHYAALVVAIPAFFMRAPARPVLVTFAAIAILIAGSIGVFHAGVEYQWWQGFTACTTGGSASLDDIMAAPLVRCDVAPWTMMGISLAGFNAIFSLAGGLFIISLLSRRR
jgi:disulfide bond formation protein DsbB